LVAEQSANLKVTRLATIGGKADVRERARVENGS
jgi:hypothetical protein